MSAKLSINLLLRANFYRLWRSASFWAAVSTMFGVGIFELAVGVHAQRQGTPVPLDNRYMLFVLMSGVVLSAFCSLFVGAEYSDGAIRNKIAVGHSRAAVYLANLVTCSAAGVLVCLGYILPMTAAGIPLMGGFTLPPASVLWFTLCAFLMTASLCAVFACAVTALLPPRAGLTGILLPGSFCLVLLCLTWGLLRVVSGEDLMWLKKLAVERR